MFNSFYFPLIVINCFADIDEYHNLGTLQNGKGETGGKHFIYMDKYKISPTNKK